MQLSDTLLHSYFCFWEILFPRQSKQSFVKGEATGGWGDLHEL